MRVLAATPIPRTETPSGVLFTQQASSLFPDIETYISSTLFNKVGITLLLIELIEDMTNTNDKTSYTMAASEDMEKPPQDIEEMIEAQPEPAAATMTGSNEPSPGKVVNASAEATSKSLNDSTSTKKTVAKKVKKTGKPTKVPAKFRTKRPSGTPKRPLSAYNYFFREQRNLMLEERSRQKEAGTLPEIPVDPSGNQKKSSLFAMMGKTIAKRWKELSTDEHKKYKDLANEDLKRYRTEMDEFHLAQAKESRLSIERIYAKEEMRNKQNAEMEAAQKQQFQGNMPGTAPGMAGAIQQQGQPSEANSSDQAAFERLFSQQFGRAPQQGSGGPADYLAMVRNQGMLPGIQQQQQQQQAPFMGYNQQQGGLNPYGLGGSSLPPGLAGLMPAQAGNMNQQQFLFGGGAMNGQQGAGGLPESGGAGQQQQQPAQGSYEALLSSMNGASAPTMEGAGDPLGASMNSLQQQQEQQRLASFSPQENQNNMAGMQQQFLQQQLQQQQQQQLMQQQFQQQQQQQQQQLQYMNMNGAGGGGGAQPQYSGNK
jgi:hypothetical protein